MTVNNSNKCRLLATTKTPVHCGAGSSALKSSQRSFVHLEEEELPMQMKAIRNVLDRLSTCISTISRLVDYIQSAMESVALEDDETETIGVLQSQVSYLLASIYSFYLHRQFFLFQVNK